MAQQRNWGDELVDAITKAIDGNDYDRLNYQIRRTMEDAVDAAGRAGRAFTEASQNASARSKEFDLKRREKLLFKNPTKGFTLFGTGFAGLIALGGIVTLNITNVADWAFMLAFAGLTALGVKKLKRMDLFKRIRKELGNKSYVDLKHLEKITKRNHNSLVKDLNYMINKDWFIQGHLDQDETTLMVDNETYEEYLRLDKQRKQAQREEEERRMQQEMHDFENPQIEIVRRGRAFEEEIHRCNEAIPGEEISAKIEQMENIISGIFDRIEEHPDMVDQVRKLLDFYLPTTVKLLHAYEELDAQEVEVDNIANSKREIEDSLDALNDGFQKLLDTLFQNQAWDVSSDISVLQTMMAQDGLKESGF